jgi:hypothetical protein
LVRRGAAQWVYRRQVYRGRGDGQRAVGRVPIELFAAPYPKTDRELMRVTEELRRRLQAPDHGNAA